MKWFITKRDVMRPWMEPVRLSIEKAIQEYMEVNRPQGITRNQAYSTLKWCGELHTGFHRFRASKAFRKKWEREKQEVLNKMARKFKQLIEEAKAAGFKRSAKLAAKADKEGMSPADVARFPDLLDQIDLEPEDVSHGTIHKANEILKDYSEYIKSINARHKVVTELTKHATTAERPITEKQEPGKKRQKIYGYPATAFIRWMGKEGYNFLEAKKVLKKLAIDISDVTIKIQMKAGKDEDESRGPPAPLTKKQANEVFEIIDS